MKHTIFLFLCSILIIACGAPQVDYKKQPTTAIIQKDTIPAALVGITEVYQYKLVGEFYQVEHNKVSITDTSLVLNGTSYLYIDDHTLGKLENTNMYKRVEYRRGANFIRIGHDTYYKKIPSLSKDGKASFLNANELIVKKGYTLSYISRVYNISITELCNINNISPDKPLTVGQVVKLY